MGELLSSFLVATAAVGRGPLVCCTLFVNPYFWSILLTAFGLDELLSSLVAGLTLLVFYFGFKLRLIEGILDSYPFLAAIYGLLFIVAY